MAWARRFWLRLQTLLRRNRNDQRLDEEIQFHLDQQIAENISAGMSREEARYAAHRTFGNPTFLKEKTRDTWGWRWLENLYEDLRYGLRMLRKSPGFTATTILSLALGIGANTAIFSLMDALMLRWLPVRDPQNLILLKMRSDPTGDPFESFSYPIVRALAEQRDICEGAAGFSGWLFNAGFRGSIVAVQGAVVTGTYYETLGLNPTIGRLLTVEDDRAGAPLVAVISYGYWERQFARDTAVKQRSCRDHWGESAGLRRRQCRIHRRYHNDSRRSAARRSQQRIAGRRRQFLAARIGKAEDGRFDCGSQSSSRECVARNSGASDTCGLAG
jgi:hypothetical protein